MITTLVMTPLGGNAFRLDWASDLPASPAPVYFVYRDGVLVTTTQLKSLVVGIEGDESPVYEVLDDPAARPGAAYPSYALLAWYAAPGASEYRVEERVGGAWIERATIPDEGDRGLPPRYVVNQTGTTQLNGTFTLEYAPLAPAVHRWHWTDGTTTVEIYASSGEWLLRLYNAAKFVTYSTSPDLPEYPPTGLASELAADPWTLQLANDGTPKGHVAGDRPTGNYFTWRSRALEDSAVHRFRVTPVGLNGNDGAASEFVVAMTRIPDPPPVSFAFNSPAATVTISAA